MSRTAALFVLALTLATPAAAEGIHLRWTNCVADGGTSNLAFACNTNQQTHVLATSFVLDAPRTVMSITATIDIVSASPVLSPWWDFDNCRSGSLNEGVASGPSGTCPIWNQSCSGGGINFFVVGTTGPNTGRVEFTAGSCGLARNLPAGVEIVGPVLAINSTRTLGSPSCAGCGTGACLTLTRLRMGTTGDVTTPVFQDGNRVMWQGGGPGGVCALPTSARPAVWGAVKALFR